MIFYTLSSHSLCLSTLKARGIRHAAMNLVHSWILQKIIILFLFCIIIISVLIIIK